MFIGKNVIECINAAKTEGSTLEDVLNSFANEYQVDSPIGQFDFFKELAENYEASPFNPWSD